MAADNIKTAEIMYHVCQGLKENESIFSSHQIIPIFSSTNIGSSLDPGTSKSTKSPGLTPDIAHIIAFVAYYIVETLWINHAILKGTQSDVKISVSHFNLKYSTK